MLAVVVGSVLQRPDKLLVHGSVDRLLERDRVVEAEVVLQERLHVELGLLLSRLVIRVGQERPADADVLGLAVALLDKAVAQPRLNMAVVAAFAGVALVLACVGIYGVVAFFVAQRTQEIGVRMSLGASRGEIALLFVRRALTTAAIGLAGGTAAALALSHLIASQLYGVRADDPWVYAVSVLALLAPVVAATLRPAWRAASVNPVEALRTE